MSNILDADKDRHVLGEPVDIMQQPIGWMGFVQHIDTGSKLHFAVLMPADNEKEVGLLVRPFENTSPFHSGSRTKKEWLELWEGDPRLETFNPAWIVSFDRAFWYPPQGIIAAYSLSLDSEMFYEKILAKDKQVFGEPRAASLTFLKALPKFAQQEYEYKMGEKPSTADAP